MIIVAIVVTVITVVSLGCIFVPGISVQKVESVNAGIVVIFVMDVHNDNAFFEKAATIYCEVHTISGNTYTATRSVTLGPGETLSQLTLTVTVPFSEMSAEPATKIYVR
jgi:hypothetical protein